MVIFKFLLQTTSNMTLTMIGIVLISQQQCTWPAAFPFASVHMSTSNEYSLDTLPLLFLLLPFLHVRDTLYERQ